MSKVLLKLLIVYSILGRKKECDPVLFAEMQEINAAMITIVYVLCYCCCVLGVEGFKSRWI